MSDHEARIWAEADADDMALITPFSVYIAEQEAFGRVLSHRELMQEFFEFWRPAGATDAQIDAAVEKAIREGHELRMSKMD